MNSETKTSLNAVGRSEGTVRLWRQLVGCSTHVRPPLETHDLRVTTDGWMEQAAWMWRQSTGGSDHRRRWFGEASRHGMTVQCREDNDMPEHTTGIVSALELATSGVVRRAEGLCVLTSSPRRSVERRRWELTAAGRGAGQTHRLGPGCSSPHCWPRETERIEYNWQLILKAE